MKSFEELAKAGYEAHRQEFFKQRGFMPPPWQRLDLEWHACWIAAAKELAAQLANIH